MITTTQAQDKIVEKLWGKFEDVLTDENNTSIIYKRVGEWNDKATRNYGWKN